MDDLVLFEYYWEGMHRRIRAPKGCIYNNADSNIKFEKNAKSIINSAAYIAGNTIYITVFSNEAQTLVNEEFYNNNWSNVGNAYFTVLSDTTPYYAMSIQTNGSIIYMWALYGFGGDVTVISNNLPVFYNVNEYLNYIQNLYIQYQWSSVPAISGKNGILLPLSTLNDVNNGEEITTSDTSKFSLTEASNVAKLVGNIINAQG